MIKGLRNWIATILRFISSNDRRFEKKYNDEKAVKEEIRGFWKTIKNLLLNTRDRMLFKKLFLKLTKIKLKEKVIIMIFDINIQNHNENIKALRKYEARRNI